MQQRIQILHTIIFIIGVFLLPFGLIMTIPAALNFYSGCEWKGFITGTIITSLSSLSFILLGKLHKLHGTLAIFVITSCVWISMSLFAALPFYLSNMSYIDALFEGISGLTTTGATILKNVEDQPCGILLWRSILHSIGGLGIITTGIAVFPVFKVLSLNSLLYSEHSDVIQKRFSHTRSVVIHILLLYYMLILLCILFYYLAGMSLFDSICHGMSTVSTGGFANYEASLKYYNSPTIEVVTIIFMILGSLPFLSYLKMVKDFSICKDKQILFFIKIISISSIISCFWLYQNSDLETSLILRYSVFTIVSMITSTGYSICNYIDWGFISVLAFFLAFIGGCSGSASGGIKIFRIISLFRSVKNYFYYLLSSDSCEDTKFNSDKYITGFFISYVLTFVVSSVIMSYLSSADFVTSISSVSAMLTNSGPGMSNLIGPQGNYSSFSAEVKFFLSVLMLLGRLEMLPIYFSIYNFFIQNK